MIPYLASGLIGTDLDGKDGTDAEFPIPRRPHTWEPWDYVHAPDLIAEFYWNHPGAARCIRSIEFQSIPFQSAGTSLSEGGGVDVRGLPVPDPHQKTTPLYIIPQRRMNTLSGDH